MGYNTQAALIFGRRQRPIVTMRILLTFITTTMKLTSLVKIAAAKSGPLSVSAKRGMSMINQLIRVNVEVPFNILVREQVIPVVVEQLVAESIRVVNVKVAMSGTEQLVKILINMLVIGNVNLLTERLIMVCINLVIVLVDGYAVMN